MQELAEEKERALQVKRLKNFDLNRLFSLGTNDFTTKTRTRTSRKRTSSFPKCSRNATTFS